jgi:hypothetical protein
LDGEAVGAGNGGDCVFFGPDEQIEHDTALAGKRGEGRTYWGERAGHGGKVGGDSHWVLGADLGGVASLPEHDRGCFAAGRFKVSTTGPTDTAAYTHVFTLADRDELLWGSVYHAIGEGTVGSGRYARTIKDVRLSSLAINASHRNGISVEAAGLGIQDAASAAGPTLNAEPDAALNPATAA